MSHTGRFFRRVERQAGREEPSAEQRILSAWTIADALQRAEGPLMTVRGWPFGTTPEEGTPEAEQARADQSLLIALRHRYLREMWAAIEELAYDPGANS